MKKTRVQKSHATVPLKGLSHENYGVYCYIYIIQYSMAEGAHHKVLSLLTLLTLLTLQQFSICQAER